MNVVHANPIVVSMAESRPQEAMVANRYHFRVVTTGQGFVSVSELPTCMVPGPHFWLLSLLFLSSSIHPQGSKTHVYEGRSSDDHPPWRKTSSTALLKQPQPLPPCTCIVQPSVTTRAGHGIVRSARRSPRLRRATCAAPARASRVSATVVARAPPVAPPSVP